MSSGAWPLAVIASERGETFLISAWAHNPADPASVCAYMRTALERLAETLETAPDTPAASIDVMPEEERHKLIIEWNATGAAYPRDKYVHELFEEQAARTPDATADPTNEPENSRAYYPRYAALRNHPQTKKRLPPSN